MCRLIKSIISYLIILIMPLFMGAEKGAEMGKKIKGLRQKPMLVTHLGCIKGCLEYLNIDVSDAWLFGGTGHAFIINISEPVGPCGPTGWNTEKFFKLGENIGYTIEGVRGFKSDSDFAEKQKEAWTLVRQAIDKGSPCYGWELEYPDFFVIYGYDDKGYYFLDPLCDSGKGPKSWEELGKGNTGKLEVYTVKPNKPADPIKVIKKAFEFALEHAEGRYKPTWIDMKFETGAAGFEHWIKTLSDGKASRFGVAYNAAVWYECRTFAVEFLKEAKERIGGESVPLFDEAIEHYGVVAQNLKKVSEIFPFPPKDEIKGISDITRAIECLQKAQEAEKLGLESLKKIDQAFCNDPRDTPRIFEEKKMSLKQLGIEHKTIKEMLVASIRLNIKERKEIYTVLDELTQHIPEEHIIGPGFCIFHFVTSVKQGFDVEVGLPVAQAIETDRIKTRILPKMEVLSFVHIGPVEKLKETYGKLFTSASEYGLISDEFCREVFPDSNNQAGGEIELQFVLHNWNELFGKNLERVLGKEAGQKVMQGSDEITLTSTINERFCWVKGAMERLDNLADENQKYDILSSCAHVFPKGQIEKLKVVYEEARTKTNDPLKAIDAVIQFMGDDPGWGEPPLREGNVIYSTKQPRNPQAYKNAKSQAEKRKSYCFCPLVRNHLDKGMSITFCFCGAGWFRQQWEGVIGKPVRIEVMKSVLKGDDVCQFAIHLPEDL